MILYNRTTLVFVNVKASYLRESLDFTQKQEAFSYILISKTVDIINAKDLISSGISASKNCSTH